MHLASNPSFLVSHESVRSLLMTFIMCPSILLSRLRRDIFSPHGDAMRVRNEVKTPMFWSVASRPDQQGSFCLETAYDCAATDQRSWC